MPTGWQQCQQQRRKKDVYEKQKVKFREFVDETHLFHYMPQPFSNSSVPVGREVDNRREMMFTKKNNEKFSKKSRHCA